MALFYQDYHLVIQWNTSNPCIKTLLKLM
jgi:hypothetical protein